MVAIYKRKPRKLSREPTEQRNVGILPILLFLYYVYPVAPFIVPFIVQFFLFSTKKLFHWYVVRPCFKQIKPLNNFKKFDKLKVGLILTNFNCKGISCFMSL